MFIGMACGKAITYVKLCVFNDKAAKRSWGMAAKLGTDHGGHTGRTHPQKVVYIIIIIRMMVVFIIVIIFMIIFMIIYMIDDLTLL